MNFVSNLKRIGKTIYKWWMAFARAIGTVNAMVLLTIVYFCVIGPMSIISRLLGKDLLAHRKSSGSFWKTKEPVSHTLTQARRQF
ncbi:MAG: SxtJ family membrane protein [Candidatus Kryptoniota bacterium]